MVFDQKIRVIFLTIVKNIKNNKVHQIYYIINIDAPIIYLLTPINIFIYKNNKL